MALPGRHAVVTGAGSGIGRAIALRLAAEGAQVSLVGRRQAPLQATSDLAAGAAPPANAPSAVPGIFPGDVRDPASIREALNAASGASGPIDVVIANAGVGGANGPGFQSEDDPDRFSDLVQTNLAGTYHTFRAAIPLLRASGANGNASGGAPHLVAISSVLARIGVAGYSGYCASKAGITGLVRALAMELAPKAIQVNAVAPGWVDTEMAQEGIDGMAKGLKITHDEAHALAMQDVPLGRMGQPEEIAGLVNWLVSADARGMTGQTLDMNGGAYMI